MGELDQKDSDKEGPLNGNGQANGNGHANGSAQGSQQNGQTPHRQVLQEVPVVASDVETPEGEEVFRIVDRVGSAGSQAPPEEEGAQTASSQRWAAIRKDILHQDGEEPAGAMSPISRRKKNFARNGEFSSSQERISVEGPAAFFDAVKFLVDVRPKDEPVVKAPPKKQVKGILKPPRNEEEEEVKAAMLKRSMSKSNLKDPRRKSEMLFHQIQLKEQLAVKKHVRFHIEKKRSSNVGIKLPAIRKESDTLVLRWKGIFIVPLAYETWAFPFRLALGDTGYTTLLLLDIVCDAWFILDGVVHCFIAIPGEGSLTRLELGWRYMKDVFPTELLPSVIYIVIALEFNSLWLFWAAGLPRLVPRMQRLRQYFKKMEMNLDVDVDQLQMIKFTLVIFLSCHWVGSLYYFIARLLDFASNTWVGQFELTMPGVFTLDSPVQERYLALLYRGWIGLAPNSYRRPPQNWPEQIFSVLVMFMAMYLSAYLIGTVLPYIVKRDPVAEANAKRRADFLVFANQRALPADLVSRVLQYYDFQNTKMSEKSGELSGVKLTRTLEIKVARKKYGPYIERNTGKGLPLNRCEQNFINSLVTKLKEVYMMPGEEFIRAGDVARELYFVANGAVQLVENGTVVREIRGDVADMPCICGELSFFLGIAQSQSARTRDDGDVRMLVLSREASEKLLTQYPEQQELILKNILAAWNLDMRGNDLSSAAQEDEKEGNDEQRLAIISALKHREREAFASLNFAASMGDIEEVRRLIRRGADVNLKDYDGRTILHMACNDGNIRVVELLLENGAEKNVKSRWGTTPLMEAIYAKQTQVVHLMLNAKAEMLLDDPSGILCDWASRGDVDNLKVLLSNDVDPNCGDYDARTPIHLAASEGNDKVVEMLISYGADVNVKDRWGGTPLKDAVVTSNVNVAALLRSKGARLPDGVGSGEFCTAASVGDVAKLRMLHSCGVNPDEGDYDFRASLHLAAAEARLLVVSFLLGVSASVNVKDRWGGTPLDDCVRGDTLYHMMCGKLILGWGGRLGTFEGTEEGRQALERMNKVNMEEVSALIKRLIKSGLYDNRESTVSDQDLLIAKDATSILISKVGDLRLQLVPVSEMLDEARVSLATTRDAMSRVMRLTARLEDNMPPATVNSIFIEPDQGASKSSSRSMLQRGQSMKNKLDAKKGDKTSKLQQLENFFSGLTPDHLDPDVLLEEEVDDAHFQLYKELDDLVLKMERNLAMGVAGRANTAKSLNRFLMQLFEVEEMLQMLEDTFRKASSNTSQSIQFGMTAVNCEGLMSALEILGIDHLEEEDIQDIMDEAADHPTSSGITVTAQGLMCCSPTFRGVLNLVEGSDMDGNELKYAYLTKNQVLKRLPYSWLRHASEECETKSIKAGNVLYRDGQVPQVLYIVKSGAVQLVHNHLTGKNVLDEQRDESTIAYFEFFVGEAVNYTVEVSKDAELIAVPFARFQQLLKERPKIAADIAQTLAKDGDVFHKKSMNVLCAQFIKRFKTVVEGEWSDEDLFGLVRVLRVRFDVPLFPDGFGEEDSLETETLLLDLRQGLKVVEDSWYLFSYGADTVEIRSFDGIADYLGEVGAGFMVSVFEVIDEANEINIGQWWECWIEYLNGTADAQGATGGAQQDTAGEEEEVIDWMLTSKELFHTFFERRKFKKLLLDESNTERYEPAFLLTVGNVVDPLLKKGFKKFLEAMFQDKSVERHHLYVFVELFGKKGIHSNKITWAQMRKVLVEQAGDHSIKSEPFFMDKSTVFNPSSAPMQQWFNCVRLLAAYHFIVVPVRLTYKPFDDISDVGVLASDLVADMLTIIHVLVSFNTAYLNKKSRWVTNRRKIAKKYLSNGFYLDAISAFPLDWIVVVMGVDLEVAEWTRLLKMFLMRVVVSGFATSRSAPKGMGRLAVMAFMVLHLSACVWSGLGLSSHVGFTLHTSWLEAESAADFIQGIHGDSRQGISMWELYCMSLNWVATHTVSAIGNTTLYPKNYAEVIFAICQLTVGMTFYRMVLGQISSIVMKADEKIIKVRGELGSLENYIVNNKLADDAALSNEIRKHFQALQHMQIVDMADVMDNLNHSLQFEMARLLCREALDNCELFHGCSVQMLDRLSVILREVQFGPEEEMFQLGDVSDEMFLVVTGSVEKVQLDFNGAEISGGSVKVGGAVGEVSFSFGMKHLYGARAGGQSGAVCLRLTRTNYLQVLKLYPEDEDTIAQNSLTCFEKAKVEHGSSKAGSKKGTSAVGEDVNQLAIQEAAQLEEEHSINSEGDDDSGGGDSEGFDAMIGSGIAQHIHTLKIRQANNRVMQLLDAACNNDMIKLKKLLKRGVSVNDCDSSKRTALHIASSEGHVDLVRYLLEQQADVSIKDTQDNTALNDAVREKKDDVAALIREMIPGTHLSYEGAMGAVNLCQAAYEGDMAELQRLIDNGVSVNAADYDQRTALHLASCEGHTEVVNYLLENKAYVNARDRFSGTALQDAVRHERLEVQKVLKEAQCQIVGMETAIQMCEAASVGDLHTLKTFCENGVDANLADYDKRTALHLAASNGKVEILNYLLNLDPKISTINPVDRLGGTPLDDALRHNQEVAIKMLQVFKAKTQGDPALAAEQEEQEILAAKQAKAVRAPQVELTVQQSTEVKEDDNLKEFMKLLIDEEYESVEAAPDAEKTISMVSAFKEFREQSNKVQELLAEVESILKNFMPENVKGFAGPGTLTRTGSRSSKGGGSPLAGTRDGQPELPGAVHPLQAMRDKDAGKGQEEPTSPPRRQLEIAKSLLDIIDSYSLQLTNTYKAIPNVPDLVRSYQFVVSKFASQRKVIQGDILYIIALSQHLRHMIRAITDHHFH